MRAQPGRHSQTTRWGAARGATFNASTSLPDLLAPPATIRFLSYEPALGRADFTQCLPDLDWVIVGGESGPGSRPFDLAWATSTIAQCKAAGVACFVKQLGARPIQASPTGTVRVKLHDRKGDDISEWVPDFHDREFSPAALATAPDVLVAKA